LVTGGTGFIGANVVRLLIRDGEQVVIYDINPDRKMLDTLLGKNKSSQLKLIQGNVTDPAHLIRTCQEYDVDRIIHLSALLVLDAAANPLLAVQVNCEGTINVFETARILHLKRVVWASTMGVFGSPEKHEQELIPNDAPHYPTNIYSASKSFNEIIAAHYFNEYGVDNIAIRYASVYGEGQTRGFTGTLAQELFVKPVLGKPGRVPCMGDTYNWMYVEDAARVAIMASKVTKTQTRVFNVGGDVRSFAEVVAYVKTLVPKAKITLVPVPAGLPSKFDTTPAREELGYHPEWTMEKGVKKVIDYIRRQHSNNYQD
jgi:nucleoside-diphosphate-sugar epimerase